MATLYVRSGRYYANYRLSGRQVRHSLGTRNESTAQKLLQALTASKRIVETPAHHPQSEASWDVLVKEGLATSGGWLANLFQRTKHRAMNRFIPFDLTRSQLQAIALRSAGACELSGLQFSWDKVGVGRFPPYAPSLDRVVPANGYTTENCRLVCYAVNVALSDWGEEVLQRIAGALKP